MPDSESQTILRCGLCNKPFDKQSTLKRHGYYCRSRNGNSRPVRLRSCVACAKAKARCDNKLPSCTRCVTKGIECRSRGDSTGNGSSSEPTSIGRQGARRPARKGSPRSTVAETSQAALDIDTVSPGRESSVVDLDFTNFGEEQFAWDLLDMNIPEFENLDDQSSHPSLLESTNLLPINQSGLPANARTGQIVSMRSSPASIPTMPVYNLRSFAQNPAIRGGTQTTAMLMVRILTSYPMMMRSEDSLPPFIHPHSLSNNTDSESGSSESLTTCLSLMQIMSTNVQGGRKLLWKNVRFECERMREECGGLDRWGLLSSMQALLIYVLLRLQEGETTYNNFDVLLLSTLWEIACALNLQIGNVPCGTPFGLSYGPSREDWIFEESRRRLAVTFRTISMLYSMEPSSGCVPHDGFLLTPLPARKQLWEARDESAWMLERSRDIGGPSVFSAMVGGQMVRLNEYEAVLGGETISVQPVGSKESSANWQEWCSGMDGLGALIMLAASLPIF